MSTRDPAELDAELRLDLSGFVELPDDLLDIGEVREALRSARSLRKKLDREIGALEAFVDSGAATDRPEASEPVPDDDLWDFEKRHARWSRDELNERTLRAGAAVDWTRSAIAAVEAPETGSNEREDTILEVLEGFAHQRSVRRAARALARKASLPEVSESDAQVLQSLAGDEQLRVDAERALDAMRAMGRDPQTVARASDVPASVERYRLLRVLGRAAPDVLDAFVDSLQPEDAAAAIGALATPMKKQDWAECPLAKTYHAKNKWVFLKLFVDTLLDANPERYRTDEVAYVHAAEALKKRRERARKASASRE